MHACLLAYGYSAVKYNVCALIYIGRWTKQLKLVLKQQYQFYVIDNIDEYVKEEDTKNDGNSNAGSENGDDEYHQGGTHESVV